MLDSAAGLKFITILVYNMAANVEACTYLDILLASMSSWKSDMYELKSCLSKFSITLGPITIWVISFFFPSSFA